MKKKGGVEDGVTDTQTHHVVLYDLIRTISSLPAECQESSLQRTFLGDSGLLLITLGPRKVVSQNFLATTSRNRVCPVMGAAVPQR